jgi:hypothetical protein
VVEDVGFFPGDGVVVEVVEVLVSGGGSWATVVVVVGGGAVVVVGRCVVVVGRCVVVVPGARVVVVVGACVVVVTGAWVVVVVGACVVVVVGASVVVVVGGSVDVVVSGGGGAVVVVSPGGAVSGGAVSGGAVSGGAVSGGVAGCDVGSGVGQSTGWAGSAGGGQSSALAVRVAKGPAGPVPEPAAQRRTAAVIRATVIRRWAEDVDTGLSSAPTRADPALFARRVIACPLVTQTSRIRSGLDGPGSASMHRRALPPPAAR